MAATFAWSRDLLNAPARSLLARLSVCAGGFSLATAEEVGVGPPVDVLAALAELVERSLVTRTADVEDTERFRLLDPVRQSAAIALGGTERDDARSALTARCWETARGLLDDLRGANEVSALRLLEADLGNLRVTFEHCIAGARADDAAELLWLLWFHLGIRGHAREGSAWAERLAPLPMGNVSRVRWLVGSAGVGFGTNPVQACRRAQEGMAVARRIGHDALAAEAAMLAVLAARFSETCWPHGTCWWTPNG